MPQEASAKKILYGMDDPKTPNETGTDPYIKDNNTNEPSVRNQILISVSPGKHILYAKYIDNRGIESAVKEYPMEILPFFVGTDTVPFDPSSPTRSLNAEFQATKGWTFKGFEYSIDTESFNHKTQSNKVIIKDIPRGIHTLNVRGILSDGTTTSTSKTPLYLN